MDKWDSRFMRIAEETASWSKHPHTKVGAVAVDCDHHQRSGGFNGLPRGVDDAKILNQNSTVSCTVHAEANLVAAAARVVLNGTTVYVTRPTCAQCSALLIQAAVRRVVYPRLPLPNKWVDDCCAGYDLLLEAGVEVVVVD